MRDQRTDSAAPAHNAGQVRAATPAERSLRARLAAYTMHAQRDSRETSAPGRAAFLARFEREVDPDSTLDPEERQRRAALARSAYFTRLSLRAIQARKARRAQRSQGGEAA
jgi:hypothetical protein